MLQVDSADPVALRPQKRNEVMTDEPAELCDDIWLSDGICPNCRSSGAVTDEVITSGLAPG